MKDGDGLISRRVPLNDEALDILNRQKEEFFRRFEREPGKDDPVFLLQYLYSPEDLQRMLVDTMVRADIDPAKIYAYKKTGVLVSESNLHLSPTSDVDEWDEAFSEFEDFGGDPEDGTEGAHFDELVKRLLDELETLIYVLGLSAHKFLNTDAIPSADDPRVLLTHTQYQALCLTRTHKTLRSIHALLKNHFAEDAFTLARAIYENYLHFIYVRRYPHRVVDLVDAVIGLRAGTHSYKKRTDGSVDKRVVVEASSGLEFLGHVSAFKMAESSDLREDLPFFDFFYRRTSEFLHPSVFSLDSYLSEHGFDPVKHHMFEEAVIFSACVASMVVDQLPSMENCPTEVSRDVRTVVKRIKGLLLDLLGQIDIWHRRIGASSHDIDLLKSRCERLAADS